MRERNVLKQKVQDEKKQYDMNLLRSIKEKEQIEQLKQDELKSKIF